MLSKRVQALSPSLTIAVATLAKELKAAGKDIVSFSAGEPDFDTPRKIKEEAIKAINDGFTKYTATAGIPELLKAISGKLKRDNNLDYEPNQIIVSNGAKQSLFNLFQAVIDDGDEVIIPAPYWVTYPELVVYSGGVPVIIDTDEKSGFKITPEQLKNAITPNTKMLILTSPSNPTGCVYSKEELVEISKVLKGTDILVASDEMYEKLVFGTNFVSTASISDDMFQRTITINGLSKSVAMTGWRFGYLASPNKELIAAMDKLQSQSTSNINSITQKAAIVALNGEVDDEIEQMRKAFEGRANKAVELLNSIDGISVLKPQGAFYLFVNIKDVSDNSIEFCKELLKETGVAVVPGVGFGSEGYFRFSFATNMTTIQDGIRRIKKFVEKS
ncbi:Aspartate aminotransferase [Sulfurovum sp. enrichment culture clone C5]|uniref:Aspartate aminotransferase n=1 Tax=Sulfurovum sp. enrichment culture clone C5 TaxID=497650 RepID=A0A0S4XNH9_9BACT|nr:Aspartate aminotransferase [Sulfurovum sp. enrichment culture clone C5]